MKNFLKSIITRVIGDVIAAMVLVFLFVMFIQVTTRGIQAGKESIENNSILHVKIRGPIYDKMRALDLEAILNSRERGQGLYELTRAIEIAKNDNRIKGIYLEIRAFDAGWSSVQSLRKALLDFSQSKKFVYAYADAYNEKGYFLATAADKIFLEPNGDLELNGLAMSEFFLKGLFEKLEVQPRIFRVGKFKAAIEPLILDKMSAENKLQNQMLLNDIWSEARKSYVAVSKKTNEELDQLVNNLEISSAESALKNNLVHQLAYEDEVIELMKSKTTGKDKDLNIVGPIHLIKDEKQKNILKKQKNKIALIFAEGEMTMGESSKNSMGSETLVAELQEAEEDKDVKAIVIRVNSPGGDALAADVIWREVSRIDKKIPVLVSMGDVAASGGYYMSAGARYIMAEPTTITGSIGVFGVMPYTEKLFRNKLGISFDGVSTHAHSDLSNSNRQMTDVESKFIQSSVERVYKRFLEVVQKGRNFQNPKEVEEIAEGRVWSGLKAKEIGLVDELGNLKNTITKAAQMAQLGSNYQVEVVPKDEEKMMMLFEKYFGESIEERVYSWLGFQFTGLSLNGLKTTLGYLGLTSIQNTPASLKSGVYTRMESDFSIN